jgi:uncharacterized membrane protein
VSGTAAALALAVFGASAVEMVEALTIVLAAAVARGTRSALEGAFAAVALLAVLVAGLGLPVLAYVPLAVVRVVVGVLLLVLGLSWLRKAVLRAAGHRPARDEDAVFARTVGELGGASDGRGRPRARLRETVRAPRDAAGFAVAFKGVLLEGLEVVLIVVTLGTSARDLGLAAAAAGAAALVVAAAGLLVARQLSGVPENALKLGVGVMLTSFGVFWLGEGAGVGWPGGDAAVPVLVALFAGLAGLLVAVLRPSAPARRAA